MTQLSGPEPGATEVTVWSLELTAPDQIIEGPKPSVEPLLLRARRPAPTLAKFFYAEVGRPWGWFERRDWTDEQWIEWTARPDQFLVSCWVDGVPAGYFDIVTEAPSTEIKYFGLVPEFHGVGLGGWLLERALRTGFEVPGTERVWLHTCSLDGPAALPNYRARGMTLFDTTTEWHRLDEP